MFVIGAHSGHRETIVFSPSSLKSPLPFGHETAVDIRITQCLVIKRVSCKKINKDFRVYSGNSREEFPHIIALHETSKRKV